MKVFRIIGRTFRDSLKSVFRNFSLSIASITCITITLILVAISILLSYNVNDFTKSLESDLTIVAFMKRECTDEEANILKELIINIDNVEEKSLEYMSKEDVKVSMQKESDVFNNIMSTWTPETNPLQNEFIIKVEDINDISKTAEQIKKLQYVDSVKYGEGMVDQLVNIFDLVKKCSVVIVLALIVVTAFLISNTIKLTIFSRKTEIEIMRLVGTSNIAIKLPFIFEGLILGILGSIIPMVLSVYGYIFVYDKFDGYLFTRIIQMVEPMKIVFYVAIILLIIGALVGMLGSYKAVRKHLKI